MRTKTVIRRFVAAIVMAVAVIAAAATVTRAITAHYSPCRQRRHQLKELTQACRFRRVYSA